MFTKNLLRQALPILLLSAFSIQNVKAQTVDEKPPTDAEPTVAPHTTGFSGTGANIDVKYYRCNWRINPDSAAKGIKGHVVTYFQTIAANVTSISFDINSVLVIDSVRFRGARLPAGNVTRSGNIATIALGATLANAFLDSITIYYKGVPPAVSGQAEGYQKKVSGANNYIYTLSESYEDRDWWPCKADMQDRPDSMDFVINVPSAFWVACNGKMIDSSVVGANRNFVFQHRYPIPTYLVAIGVAKYNVYHRGTVNIGGTNVPVVYNIFQGKTAATYTNILNALDMSRLELTAFSNKFGDYPFKNEKHGFYEFGWGGGMEHQTFSAMGASALTSWGTIAHELAHQWFGDKVTFSTWNELWLAEGFARYCEALAAELVPALGQNAATVRGGFKTSARALASNSIWIPNASITSSNTLWSSNYGSTVYERGAMVVSMLRKLLGDTQFFQACRNYLNDPALAYKSATTADLKNHFEAVSGYDLDPFFNDYIYGVGHPTYTINWGSNNVNGKINIQVTSQAKSAGATPAYFRTPIVLRIQGASSGDTTVVIYDQNGSLSKAGAGINAPVMGNTISFNLSFIPTTVTFDPFNETIATGTATKLTTLAVDLLGFSGKRNNGTNTLELELTGSNDVKSVMLQKSTDGERFTDAAAMRLASSLNGNNSYVFEDRSVNPGNTFYRARVIENDGSETLSQIVKISDDWKGRNLQVYPNPAKENVTIRWSNDTGRPVEIRMIDAAGKVALSKKTLDNSMNVPLTNMSKGVYMVQVIGEKEILAISTVLVK